MERLAVKYRLHPLAVEDALSLEHRPKMEKYDNHHFFLVPMVHVVMAAAGHQKKPRGCLRRLCDGLLDCLSCVCCRADGPFKYTYRGEDHYVRLDDEDKEDLEAGSNSPGRPVGAAATSAPALVLTCSELVPRLALGGPRRPTPPELDMQYSLRLRTSQLSIFCVGTDTLITVQDKVLMRRAAAAFVCPHSSALRVFAPVLRKGWLRRVLTGPHWARRRSVVGPFARAS